MSGYNNKHWDKDLYLNRHHTLANTQTVTIQKWRLACAGACQQMQHLTWNLLNNTSSRLQSQWSQLLHLLLCDGAVSIFLRVSFEFNDGENFKLKLKLELKCFIWLKWWSRKKTWNFSSFSMILRTLGWWWRWKPSNMLNRCQKKQHINTWRVNDNN